MRSRGEHEQHRGGGRLAQQGGEQVDRGRVRPVDVVEDEHERLRRGEPLEQRARRPVHAVALVLEHRRGGRRALRERGQDLGELRLHVGRQPVEHARVQTGHEGVERVDEDPEGQVALEL